MWLNKSQAQPSASFQQYYYYYKGSPGTYAPIVSYEFNNNLYLEGRYNYEDINTGSLYIGKTFETSSALSVSFTPIAGAVFGFYKGASIGANLYVNYKRLNLSHQPQYTLSTAGKENNFLYSWSDLSLDLTDNIAVGVSAQHTKTTYEKSLLEKGVMLQFSFKNWSLPIYAYNPQSSDRYFLIGLNYEWEGKKHKKKKAGSDPDIGNAEAVVEKDKNNLVEKPAPALVRTMIASTEGPALKVRPTVVKDPANSLFALIAGSFSDLIEAEKLIGNLPGSYGKQASVFIENGLYKVRITGFKNRGEAEGFRTAVLGNLSTAASVIYAYRTENLQMDLVEKSRRLKERI